MKKILMITGIFLPLFLFGCQTKNKNADSKFEQELMGLYSQVRSMTTQAQTRSDDGEFVPLTEAEFNEVMTTVTKISEENGIPEIVAQSGYYKSEEMPNIAEMDFYNILQWVEENGTPEFYNLMLELGEGALTAESIVENPNLLPNEKIGGLVSLGIANEIIIPEIQAAPDKVTQCLATYRVDFLWCDVTYYAGVAAGFSVGSSFGPWVAFGYELLLDYAYTLCIDRADKKFIKCVQ